jgi:Big-like domain-containing protein/parallel beta helix pectate lyase-like protein
MGSGGPYLARAGVLLSTLGVLGLLLGAAVSAAGAAAPGFPLQSSQASPVTGAVTISASDVLPVPGLVGVRFKVDGYMLDAVDATSPFQVVWSAASATAGDHTITAEALYSSGVVVESAPLVLTVANPPTFNRLLHVDATAGNDGNDGLTPGTAWRTLERANGAVVAGDTVRLRGTFAGESIAPVASGSAARPIRFTSDAGQTAVLDGGRSGVAVRLDARGYVVVEGLRIQNVSGYAVMLTPGSHHNVLRGSTITDTSGSWAHALRIEGANDDLIEGNEILNVGNEAANSGDSIYIVNGSRNQIRKNTVTNGGHSLIQLSSQHATAMSNDNVIAENTLSNAWTTPIILSWRSERTIVEHNRISDGARNGVNFPRPGIQINASNNIIRYNEIVNNAAAGVMLAAYTFQGTIPQDSIGNQIYHNVFYRNNLIQDGVNNSGAIHLRESHGRSVRDNLIANNIFFRNAGFAFGGHTYTITITHYGNPTAWPVGNLNGNRIESNLLLRQPGTAGEVMVLRIRDAGQGGNLSYTLGQFQATYAGAANNLEADPLFTDEANRVFTLRTGSPAIDHGRVLPGVAYLGTAPDLGAFETRQSGGSGESDTTPPTVALTSPASGAIVAGAVTLTASAVDDVGVTRIDYLLDGALLAVTSPPSRTFAWDATTTSSGPHQLSARAYDAAGNVGTSAPVTVTVLDANLLKVIFTSPAAGATVSGVVWVNIWVGARAVPPTRSR